MESQLSNCLGTTMFIILDYLGIYEFKRDRPPPSSLAVADTFDDWRCNDHINNDYMDF